MEMIMCTVCTKHHENVMVSVISFVVYYNLEEIIDLIMISKPIIFKCGGCTDKCKLKTDPQVQSMITYRNLQYAHYSKEYC